MGANIRAGKITGIKKEEINRARILLNMLWIEHLSDKGYKEISGGERQLVLIARALMQDTKILLKDEPIANLDFGNQIMILNKCKELAEQGYSIIQSTHYPYFVFNYFNEILIIDNKKILDKGNPKEVLTEENIKKIYNVDIHIEKINYKNNKEYLLIPE